MKKVMLTDYSEEELQEFIINAVLAGFKKLKADPPKPVYLSRKEAARKLRISEVTLSTYSKQGKIKGYFLGGKMLYLESDLDAALELVQPLKYRRG